MPNEVVCSFPGKLWVLAFRGRLVSVPMASGKADTYGTLWENPHAHREHAVMVSGGQGQVGRLLNLARQSRWDRAKVERKHRGRAWGAWPGAQQLPFSLIITSNPRLWH